MKRMLIALTLLLAVVMAAVQPAGAGSAVAAPQAHSQVNSHPHAFDKTKFVLHLGAAYFAFHHFVYKPFKDHKLGRFHIINDAKAVLAALFAYHEVKTAYNLAKGSNSKTLQLLISPLSKLGDAFNALVSKVKKGDTSALDAVNTQASSFQSLAGKNGFGFTDKSASVPGQ